MVFSECMRPFASRNRLLLYPELRVVMLVPVSGDDIRILPNGPTLCVSYFGAFVCSLGNSIFCSSILLRRKILCFATGLDPLACHIPTVRNISGLAKISWHLVLRLVYSGMLQETWVFVHLVFGIRGLVHIVRDHRLPILFVLCCCLLRYRIP